MLNIYNRHKVQSMYLLLHSFRHIILEKQQEGLRLFYARLTSQLGLNMKVVPGKPSHLLYNSKMISRQKDIVYFETSYQAISTSFIQILKHLYQAIQDG